MLKLLFAAVDGRGEDVASEAIAMGTRLEGFDGERYQREVGQLVARYAALSGGRSQPEGRLVLELVLCGTLAGPAWLAPLLRAAALWLLWATVTQMLKIAGYTTGKNAKMPVVAAVPLAVYCVAHFSAVAATVASFAFIVFSIMLLWYAVLLLRAYNTTRVKK